MNDVTSGQNRYFGYIHALSDFGIEQIEGHIRFGDYKTRSGYEMMKEILACRSRPTAIFAVSDDMAVGAMNCINDYGLTVPDDISVIGFDGSQLTEQVRPRLSSMEQPILEMGKVTVDTLLDLISGNKAKRIDDVILKHMLVVRDSSKKYVNRED